MAVAILAACSPAGRRDDVVDPVDAPAQPDEDAPPVAVMSRVYAHSGDTLYRMDPLTLAATPIGPMGGLDAALLDLAVDKNDNIVGVTASKLYSLDANTGAPTLIKTLTGAAQGLTSLSYIPGATSSDPDLLVSANGDGDVFSIDPVTGTATQIGSYGTGPGGVTISSSGDLFGVEGFGIYATVYVGGDKSVDYLAKIDPANNYKAALMPQPTGYSKIFGLGFWGGKIYGFVDNGFDASSGTMIQIEPDGQAIELSTADVRWFGAGVTTDAPIIQ